MATNPTPIVDGGRELLDSLCEAIVARRDAKLLAGEARYPQHKPRASSIGACVRELYYQVTEWERRPSPDAHLLARFERGRDIEERIVLPRLQELGFRVIGGQIALTIKDRSGRVICTGHIDGRIEWQGAAPVFDCKSLHPTLFESTRTVEDVLRHKWLRKWVSQLLLYMFAHGEPLGLFIVDDCLGHWRAIPVLLDDHLALCEDALRKCEEACDAIELGEAPPFCPDPAECRDCWAFRAGVCSPPLDYTGAGIRILDDATTAEVLARMEELEEAGEEYARLDRKLKERQKERGPGRYLCGDYLVETVEKPATVYAVPDDVKAQYKAEGSRTYTNWKRIGSE